MSIRRRTVALVLAGLMLSAPVLAGCADRPGRSNQKTSHSPDCDLGDMLEGDSDCKPKKKTTSPRRKATPR